jgi:hypothetical protein
MTLDELRNRLFVGRFRSACWYAFVILVFAAQIGCARGLNTVTGRITPVHYRFKTVVEISKRNKTRPDGWRAVCIQARITEGDSGATDVCKFEVGLPLRNKELGDIPLETAQRTAAGTANRAAHTVLAEASAGEMIAVLCLQFKERYQRMLGEEIAGARVSQCETEGIETVYFDIPGRLTP